MIKIVFCDDNEDLKNKELINAFDTVFNNTENELFYLCDNNTIYKKSGKQWDEISSDDLDYLSIFKNSYIFLDTRWDPPRDNIRDAIVLWLEDNYGAYKKAIVYSVYGRADADKFVKDLLNKKIDVLNESHFMINDISYEQYAHFEKSLRTVKKIDIDLGGNNNV